MVSKKYFVVLVILAILCSSISVQSDPKQIEFNEVHNKYCELQIKTCNHTLHPLCPTFNPKHYPIEQYNFSSLAQDDIDFVLTTLNRFRNDLAAGRIEGQNSGSNLHVVKWSDDYARLLKAKLLYRSMCTEISFTGRTILEMVAFSNSDDNVDDSDPYFYRKLFLERVVNDSTSNSPWMDTFRAEFNRIGCVYYEYDVHESKTFTCFINRYGPRDGEIFMDDLYKYGAPCSQCDGECSQVWPSLCDEPIQKLQKEWNYNYVMICVAICGCTVILIIFVLVRRINTTRGQSYKIQMEMSEG